MKKKKNIVLENIQMLSAGAKGVAVGRTAEGKTVLVTGAVPGDVVNVRVRKSKSKYYEGDVETLVESSPWRVTPRCIHFGVCGGCKWQNLSYSKQLEFKEQEVLNNIRRIGCTAAARRFCPDDRTTECSCPSGQIKSGSRLDKINRGGFFM